jgi:hypothetical protein
MRVGVPGVARLAAVLACAAWLWPGAALAAAEASPFSPWTDVASIVAVLISLAALVGSLISSHAKTQREQREELKAHIETLLSLRAEFNAKAGGFASEPEREFWSGAMQTRKSIYLESAERLAERLPFVTSAEWLVLGAEHMADSNFHHAEQMYRRAAASSKCAAAVTQAAALRALGGARMMMGPAMLAAGRKAFADAIALMGGRTDPYSAYAVALTYRSWAEAEFGAGQAADCQARFADALAATERMPMGFEYRGFEVRRCAADLMFLADTLMGAANLAAARAALDMALHGLTPFPDPASADARAQVMVARAYLEGATGDAAAAQPFVDAARAALAALPPKAPARAMPRAMALLAGVKGARP